jgi:hypothetical protein
MAESQARNGGKPGQKLGKGSNIIGCFTKAEFLQPNMSQLPGHKLDKSYSASFKCNFKSKPKVAKLTNQHKT